jgi:hypothetical protein
MTGLLESLTPEQQEAGLAPAEMAEGIADLFSETLTRLIARRDTAYADAIAPLNAEIDTLRQEHAAIGEAARALEMLLPAKARIAQHEADQFTVAGKIEESKAKLEEMRQAENAPARMRERQGEISARFEAIVSEKQAIAKRVFESWYRECQIVSRTIERGHFIVFLDGLKQAFFDFEQQTATAAKTVRDPGLFGFGHLADLTAPERSDEWQAGQRWYRGRTR